MPLSEHEQRILDEIEQKLAEEDPKFARGVNAATPYGQSVRRLKRAIGGFVIGFALLIAGLLFSEAFFVFGIGAFVVMLLSAVVIASTVKHMGRDRGRQVAAEKQSRWGRMEERWKKRFEPPQQ